MQGKAWHKDRIREGAEHRGQKQRLATLGTIKRFIYNPNGDNRDRDSLSHAEVIKIGVEFLASKQLMQSY